MNQLFGPAILFTVCCCIQIQAQYRHTQQANGYSLAAYNDSLFRGRQPVNRIPNMQYLSNSPTLQGNSFAEEQTTQPIHNNNIYQPIPSYNANSYNPTNEAELNQFGGPGPNPIVINTAARPTTLVPPVPQNQNGVLQESSYNPLYPQQQPPQRPGSPQLVFPSNDNVIPLAPIPQQPQGQQYQPVAPNQQSGSHRPVEQNQSTVGNRHLTKYEFITHFSWSIFQSSKRQVGGDANIVISPLSVQLLLSLVEQAAAGTTKFQLQNSIGNTSPSDIAQAVDQVTYSRSKNKLKIASAMFPSTRLMLNQTFREIARDSSVEVIPVDFNDQSHTRNQINSWASSATENKIRDIFSGSQRNADLILSNAVYFEGAWKFPFNQTVVDRFYQRSGQQKDVTYLKQTASLLVGSKNFKGIKFNWVELPYENDQFSMLIVLPNDFKLDELVNSVTKSYFNELIGTIESGETRRVHLRLPKFEVKIKLPLKSVMQNMGIVDLFTENANIPYLAQERVKIDDAQQDVYLSVDEKGTTAAAVTTFSVITLSSSSYDPEEMNFDVNQPFLAVILHKQTRLPIFVANMFNP